LKFWGIIIYNGVSLFLAAIGSAWWLPWIMLSEKRRKTFLPRLLFSQPTHKRRTERQVKHNTRSIWVHALSVGEVLSAAPLLKGLQTTFPERSVILTASTQTGYDIANQELSQTGIDIRFFPFDLPLSINRAFREINPAVILIVETDIWPNFIFKAQRAMIPIFLVNARLSESSFEGYRRLSFFFKPLFSTFTGICVQSTVDEERFCGIGVPPERVHLSGNLKFDQRVAPPAPPDMEALRKELRLIPERHIVVAGSTHPGEEEILLTATRRLVEKWPTFLLIIAPRNPKRADAICQMARELNIVAEKITSIAKRPPTPYVHILVVDVLGILRGLYPLADIAFLGGSLLKFGGHNPLEPAAAGKPILFGPDMSDFRAIADSLEAGGGAKTIRDCSSFFQEVDVLLGNSTLRKAMGEKALSVFQSNSGAVEKIVTIVEQYIKDTTERKDRKEKTFKRSMPPSRK
jgi:3-deoxy-D-manno-octulosonic-acid transferase